MTLPSDSVQFSVVIVNYNRCADLRAALVSIQKQEVPPLEVIVVDNASSDASREMLVREFPNVRVIALDENLGMAGYNLGFEAARAELVFQMDNDSLMPDAMMLHQVQQLFARGNEKLAIVATRVEEYQVGDEIEAVRKRDTRHGPLYTGGFHSGGVAFRREILKKMSGYNRAVFLYGSEMFLQMQFLAAGYTIAFYPEILMLHKSSGVARSARGLYYEVRNRIWFMRCFATRAQQVRFLPVMFLHDGIYGVAKKQRRALMAAWHDGWGPLPSSLARLTSDEPAFVNKVNEIGEVFGVRALWARIQNRMGATGLVR